MGSTPPVSAACKLLDEVDDAGQLSTYTGICSSVISRRARWAMFSTWARVRLMRESSVEQRKNQP